MTHEFLNFFVPGCGFSWHRLLRRTLVLMILLAAFIETEILVSETRNRTGLYAVAYLCTFLLWHHSKTRNGTIGKSYYFRLIMMKNKITFILLHKDSFILFFVVALLWFTISAITDEYYDFNKLAKYTGLYEKSSIVITKIINKPLYKDTTRELRLWLQGEKLPFHISSYKNFDKVLDSFYTIDTLSIYTKNKTLYIFGLGDQREIVHMINERNKKKIIDFRERQGAAASIKYLTGIFTIIFSTWYIVRVRNRLYWQS